MKFLQRLGILCATLVVASCASTLPRGTEVRIPPERISQKGYSVLPLNEEGWVITRRNSYQLVLGKYGKNPDETFALWAVLFMLPEFNTNEELARITKERQAHVTDPQRFTTIKNEVTVYPRDGVECVKSHTLHVEHAAKKRTGKARDMNFETLNLICAHPRDKGVGVSVAYSHRSYPEFPDPTFLEKATSILDSVQIIDELP